MAAFESAGARRAYGDGATNSHPVAVPSGVAVDDVILLHVAHYFNETVTPPIGFTELTDSPVTLSGTRNRYYWKRATGADSGTYTVGLSASQGIDARAYRFTGVSNTGDPVNATNGVSSATSATSTPSVAVTTTEPSTLLLWFINVDANTGGVVAPSGFNLDVADAVFGLATKAQATTGGSGGVVGTTSSSGHLAFLAALVSTPNVVTVQPTPVADRGSVANATAGTTSSVSLTSPTSITIGNYLLARVAVDNSGTNGAAPGCTVTDPRSHTWTVLGPALSDPGAAAAGATAYLAYTRVTTAYQAADALTFNWGGISTTAKAIVVQEWTNIHPTSPVAVTTVTANAAASTAAAVSITPTAPNQLVYICLATEGVAADIFTGDADTTNGTWTTLTTTASANATATNNQRVMGQYKVVTAAGAQTWGATITNRDWAALAVVFAPPPFPPSIRQLSCAALVRTHYW